MSRTIRVDYHHPSRIHYQHYNMDKDNIENRIPPRHPLEKSAYTKAAAKH
jgi:hypothetical protein